MIDPTSPAARHVYLDAVQVGVRRRLGDFAASRMRLDVYREVDPPALAFQLSTDLLAKTTGPQVYTDHRSASVQLVRFASWWDHFKAAYRRRWWMRWRHWEIRYTVREATAVAEVKVEATIAAVFPHAADIPDFLGRPYPLVWARPIS